MLQSKVVEVIDFLKPLLPLANCHTVDFITTNLWMELIPVEIRKEVESTNIDVILNIYNNLENENNTSSSNRNEFPHFIKFLTNARIMYPTSFHDVTLSRTELKEKLFSNVSGVHTSPRLSEFMSTKKSHEVEIMSELVAALADASNATHIVDIGSGKGYLSSMLSMHHKLAVLGIDSSQINSHGAAKRTEKLRRAWPGMFKNKESEQSVQNLNAGTYKQATTFVTQNTDLISLVEQHLPGTQSCESLALVGLHTCGDLAPTALRLFTSKGHIAGLCNVGCCYHLINEEFAVNPFNNTLETECVDNGFPMSSFLDSEQFSLGRNSRMLAAQSLERIAENSRQCRQSMESLFYRALLQVLLVEKFGVDNLPSGNVGRLAAKCSNFSDYIRKALIRLKVDIEVTDAESEFLYSSHKADQYRLQVFFLLRLVLAPAIEGLVLLDRLLYLKEKDISKAFLVQLFDPLVSPRCFAIVALKS